MTTKADNRNQFIARVKTALGYASPERRSKSFPVGRQDYGVRSRIIEKIHNRTNDERNELLGLLIKGGKHLNLEVIPKKNTDSVSQAIKELVQVKAPEWGSHKRVALWQHPLIEKLRLPEILADEPVAVHCAAATASAPQISAITADPATIRRQVIEAYIGVTSADFCVASTATLIMRERRGQARSVSLLPAIHVAVIELNQIIADLKELFVLLHQDPDEKVVGLSNCMTWITGPSKTADIELHMIHGAHGPRELHLFVITG